MESRGRSVLGEVKLHNNAAAFVPRREIPRTPPRIVHHKPFKTASPASTRQGERGGGGRSSGKSADPSKVERGGRENSPPATRGQEVEGKGGKNDLPANWDSPSNQRRVQALCFTPRKTLARSPPREMTTDDAPPKGFEIPRTPPATSKPPPSPPHNEVETCQLPRIQSGSTQIHPHPAPQKLPSPPITTASKREKRGGLLPEGLVCTENDLAFLQHRENIQQHQHLQRELTELDKAVRTAAEEKEQLQHEAQKIQTDLKQLKEKYMATLSSVRSLQLTSDDPNSTHSTRVSSGEPVTTEISHTHLAQLRQTRKLMTLQLEKTEREIQRKVSQISQEQEILQDRRTKESLNVEELSKDLENIQMEKREWEERVREASNTKQAVEKELESLQSQLKVSQSDAPDPPHSCESAASSEREKAEERLRQLARRCELYVKRHQLLKQLRQQI